MFKIFEFITESIGWLRIVASPLLIGVIIGVIVYLKMPGITGFILGAVIAALGLIVGVVWATRVWKRQGTNNFLSRIMSTPELDKKEDETITRP